MNDEEDGDFINCEDNQSQPRVRVASLEKLVDYCAEEFSKLHVASTSIFFVCFFFLAAIALLEDLFVFHNHDMGVRSFCFSRTFIMLSGTSRCYPSFCLFSPVTVTEIAKANRKK